MPRSKMDTTKNTDLEWRMMIRLPRELGEDVERLATEELMPTAVMLRRLVKERMDQIRRERQP